MPGEHRILRIEDRSRVHGVAGIAGNDFAHENEWRAMGKTEKVRSDV
jgi:hypothetical protein